MISLVFLPLLLIPKLKKEFHEKDLSIMTFNTPNNRHGGWGNYEERILEIEFETIELKGLNVSRLDSMMKLVARKNKMFGHEEFEDIEIKHGLKIDFDENSTYADIVNVLNLSSILDIDRKLFMFSKNSFFLTEPYGHRIQSDSINPTSIVDDYILICSHVEVNHEKPPESWFKKILEYEKFIEFPKIWVIGLAYFGLVFIVFITMIKAKSYN
jgi:hypothetical protein